MIWYVQLLVKICITSTIDTIRFLAFNIGVNYENEITWRNLIEMPLDMRRHINYEWALMSSNSAKNTEC